MWPFKFALVFRLRIFLFKCFSIVSQFFLERNAEVSVVWGGAGNVKNGIWSERFS